VNSSLRARRGHVVTHWLVRDVRGSPHGSGSRDPATSSRSFTLRVVTMPRLSPSLSFSLVGQPAPRSSGLRNSACSHLSLRWPRSYAVLDRPSRFCKGSTSSLALRRVGTLRVARATRPSLALLNIPSSRACALSRDLIIAFSV